MESKLIISVCSCILLVAIPVRAGTVTWNDDGWVTRGQDCDFHHGHALKEFVSPDSDTCEKHCFARPDCSHFVWSEIGTHHVCKLRGDIKVSQRHAVSGTGSCGIINIRTVVDMGNHFFGDILWRAGCKINEARSVIRTEYPTEFLQCATICRDDHHCGRITWGGGECSLFYPPGPGNAGADALSAEDEEAFPMYCAEVDPPTGVFIAEPSPEGNDAAIGARKSCSENGYKGCFLNNGCCSGYCEWFMFSAAECKAQ